MVIGTDFYIRTDHWDGDAVLVEGPLFLGPYDLVEPESESVPPSALPLCLDFTPRILSITKNIAGNCALAFAGGPNRIYQVQAATNLVGPVFWTTLTNNVDGGDNFTSDASGHWSHTDLNATNFSARFYRALLVKAQVNYAVSSNFAYVADSPHAAGDILISSTYGGYPVVSIGDYVFMGSYLTSVAIPESVTNIGSAAFAGCASLTNIAVGASNPAFSSAGGVLFDKRQATLVQFPSGRGGTYVIPNSVTNIDPYAFFFIGGLTNVTIGDSVISIGDYAFGSSGLTSVRIPDSVKRIGESAFFGCSAVSLILGNGVTNIGDYAFNSCESLTNVTVGGGGAASIGFSAFGGCLNLRSVTIGNGVASIGDYAFTECHSLISVTLADSVTSIGDGAFGGCYGLTSVTLPASVTNIGAYTFEYCFNLKSFYFRGNAPHDYGTSFFSDPATVYYLPGTTGWGSTFGGVPAVLWDPQATAVSVTSGHFGFTITGPANAVIVVEACTSLSNPVWVPVGTNTLTGDTSSFSDPQSSSYPQRFYRLRSL